MSALTSHARATSAKDRRGRILCRFPPNHRPKRSSGPMGAATLAIRLPRLSAANPPPRISRGNPEDLGSGRYGTEQHQSEDEAIDRRRKLLDRLAERVEDGAEALARSDNVPDGHCRLEAASTIGVHKTNLREAPLARPRLRVALHHL